MATLPYHRPVGICMLVGALKSQYFLISPWLSHQDVHLWLQSRPVGILLAKGSIKQPRFFD